MVGATAEAQCTSCGSDRTTGGLKSSTNRSACLCKKGDYFEAKDGFVVRVLWGQIALFRMAPSSLISEPCLGTGGSRDYPTFRLALVRIRVSQMQMSLRSFCTNLRTSKNINETGLDHHQDVQCSDNHRGIICGLCEDGFVLDSNGLCAPCSSAPDVALAVSFSSC